MENDTPLTEGSRGWDGGGAAGEDSTGDDDDGGGAAGEDSTGDDGDGGGAAGEDSTGDDGDTP